MKDWDSDHKKDYSNQGEYDISKIDQSVFDDPIKLLDYLEELDKQGKTISTSSSTSFSEPPRYDVQEYASKYSVKLTPTRSNANLYSNENRNNSSIRTNNVSKKDIYGYSLQGNTIIINEKEAQIIRTVIDLYDKGNKISGITAQLYRSKVRTRHGRDVYPGFITSIISLRRCYEGNNGYPVILNRNKSGSDNGKDESVIPEKKQETFDAARTTTKEKRTSLQYCQLEKSYIETSFCKKIQKTVNGTIMPTRETEDYLDIENGKLICQKCEYGDKTNYDIVILDALKKNNKAVSIQELRAVAPDLRYANYGDIVSTLNRLCKNGTIERETTRSIYGMETKYRYAKEKVLFSSEESIDAAKHNIQNETSERMSFSEYVAKEKKCNICGRPMKLCRSKKGIFFLGCSGYPQCSNYEGIDPNFVNDYLFLYDKNGRVCPYDHTTLLARLGKYGVYISCSSGGTRHYMSLDTL